VKSAPAEWVLFGAHLVVLDVIRARGEADFDTASECIRAAVARHRFGPAVFTTALAGGALWFHRHILGPLRETT
jgi:hypothetical protein